MEKRWITIYSGLVPHAVGIRKFWRSDGVEAFLAQTSSLLEENTPCRSRKHDGKDRRSKPSLISAELPSDPSDRPKTSICLPSLGRGCLSSSRIRPVLSPTAAFLLNKLLEPPFLKARRIQRARGPTHPFRSDGNSDRCSPNCPSAQRTSRA